ncbi:hypothetical protein Y032_0203g1814 [Ancylostoma ceylanicum]|uniref:Uncharacterized protein n=1 Tax=Ancylostoma ceylanicum TaxID=53326 RepID=A0A016SMT4_9BILA|nr:hypothetical protein Y032_0203g1814 [Ancylostoma ceylanicum]
MQHTIKPYLCKKEDRKLSVIADWQPFGSHPHLDLVDDCEERGEGLDCSQYQYILSKRLLNWPRPFPTLRRIIPHQQNCDGQKFYH